jgi:hypothetical protein
MKLLLLILRRRALLAKIASIEAEISDHLASEARNRNQARLLSTQFGTRRR